MLTDKSGEKIFLSTIVIAVMDTVPQLPKLICWLGCTLVTRGRKQKLNPRPKLRLTIITLIKTMRIILLRFFKQFPQTYLLGQTEYSSFYYAILFYDCCFSIEQFKFCISKSTSNHSFATPRLKIITLFMQKIDCTQFHLWLLIPSILKITNKASQQMSFIKYVLPIARYSLVICRNAEGRYLCVKQKNHQWYIPAGGVEQNQTHAQAAMRQTKEETGIDIIIKGILSFDQPNFGRINPIAYRVVYYAQPIDQKAVPKQNADKQSIKAQYLTIDQIVELKSFWRFPEIYNYPKYIESGGQIYPLAIFKEDTRPLQL